MTANKRNMNSTYKEKSLHINLKELSFDWTSKEKSTSLPTKGNLIPEKKSILKTVNTWFEKLKSLFNSKVARYIIYLGMTFIFKKEN